MKTVLRNLGTGLGVIGLVILICSVVILLVAVFPLVIVNYLSSFWLWMYILAAGFAVIFGLAYWIGTDINGVD